MQSNLSRLQFRCILYLDFQWFILSYTWEIFKTLLHRLVHKILENTWKNLQSNSSRPAELDFIETTAVVKNIFVLLSS